MNSVAPATAVFYQGITPGAKRILDTASGPVYARETEDMQREAANASVLRGNFEGYLAAGSKEKWLEVHGLEHWTHYYTDYGVGLQRRFFDHFLKGEDSGWAQQPPVLLQIRHPGELWRVSNPHRG